MEGGKKPLRIKFSTRNKRKRGNKLSHLKVLTNQKFAFCILGHLPDNKDQLSFLIFLLKTYPFFTHETYRRRLIKIYYYIRGEQLNEMAYILGKMLFMVSAYVFVCIPTCKNTPMHFSI